jgi:hypothetical protein
MGLFGSAQACARSDKDPEPGAPLPYAELRTPVTIRSPGRRAPAVAHAHGVVGLHRRATGRPGSGACSGRADSAWSAATRIGVETRISRCVLAADCSEERPDAAPAARR